MDEIAITQFKATCLSVMQKVKKTGKPIRVTRFGKPVADIVPSLDETSKRADWIGSMEGTGQILGDIVGPASDPEEWDAERTPREA